MKKVNARIVSSVNRYRYIDCLIEMQAQTFIGNLHAILGLLVERTKVPIGIG